MKPWIVEDKDDRLDEIIDASLSDGPQIVMRSGVEAAVVISIEEWRALKGNGISAPLKIYTNLKDWLLAPEARTDDLIPERRHLRLRPPPDFD